MARSMVRWGLAAVVTTALAVPALSVSADGSAGRGGGQTAQPSSDQGTKVKRPSLADVLAEAVGQGIITADQQAQLTELAASMASPPPTEQPPKPKVIMEVAQAVSRVADVSMRSIRQRLVAGETLGQIAGDDREAVVDSLLAKLARRLADKVEQGTITQEQADAALAERADAVNAVLDASVRLPGGNGGGQGGGQGGGNGGGSGHGGHQMPIAKEVIVRTVIDAVAETTGLTKDEIRARLKDGDTLGEVAGDTDDVVAEKAVAAIGGRLAERVAAGKLSQTAADRILEKMPRAVRAVLAATPRR